MTDFSEGDPVVFRRSTTQFEGRSTYYPEGTRARVVEALGEGRYFVEVPIPDKSLVGGLRFETFHVFEELLLTPQEWKAWRRRIARRVAAVVFVVVVGLALPIFLGFWYGPPLPAAAFFAAFFWGAGAYLLGNRIWINEPRCGFDYSLAALLAFCLLLTPGCSIVRVATEQGKGSLHADTASVRARAAVDIDADADIDAQVDELNASAIPALPGE